MPCSLLVVDDNRLIRTMIVGAVRQSQLAVGELREADSGESAWEIVVRGGVDLVLLDLNMPGMGGMGFLRRLRADPALRSIAVLVVSSESLSATLERVRELGAGFLHKPFEPEELAAAVAAMAGTKTAGSP